MGEFEGAAWNNPAYRASVSDEIVRYEVRDAAHMRRRGPKKDRLYEAARLLAWEGEARRRGIGR